MPTVLLIFEFLGTSEMLVIALVALVLFGPRKLPEIGRSLGKSLAEFKRASDEFKRTWEYEVELEHRKPALDASMQGSAASVAPVLDTNVPTASVNAADFDFDAGLQTDGQTIARGATNGYELPREPNEGAETSTQLRGDEDVDEINPS